MNQNPFFRLLLLICLWSAAAAQAQELQAQVDRTRVGEGESLRLLLRAEGQVSGAPDLSPLQQDFEILGQSQSSSISIVNGRTSSSQEWQIGLLPRRSGQLEIPSLQLGNLRSRPIGLEVVPAAQAALPDAAGTVAPVLIETELEDPDPYVQGLARYVVRVLSRVPLQQAGLGEPQGEGLLVERLGEDRSYSAQRNGQQYNVVERRFALFPQRSGDIEISAPLLTAQIPDDNGRRRGGRDPFGDFQSFFGRSPFAGIDNLFQATRPLQLRGQAQTLRARAQPGSAASPWLPAESLSLNESWSPEPDQPRVGEPLTRTIAITAQGLTAAQLPDLVPSVPAGFKLYPDQPQSETRSEGDTLVAQKTIKLAYVASQAGDIELPAVRLAWWDTAADMQREATLPARTIHVLPAVGTTAQAPWTPPAEPTVAAGQPAQPEISSAPADDDRAGSPDIMPYGYWPWLAALFLLAWLVTLSAWWRTRRQLPAASPEPTAGSRQQVVPRPDTARDALRRACNERDPRAARSALLQWAQAVWPTDPPRRLDQLAQRLDPAASAVLRELDRQLYGGDGALWDGAAAWSVLGKVLIEESRPGPAASPDPLPGLYPHSSDGG